MAKPRAIEPPRIEPDRLGVYVEVVDPTIREAGAALLSNVVDDSNRTRPAIAKLSRLSASAITSWTLGTRILYVFRLAQVLRALDYQLRLMAVPVRNGRPVKTQGEIDAAKVANVYALIKVARVQNRAIAPAELIELFGATPEEIPSVF